MLLYIPFSSHRTRNVILSQAGTDTDKTSACTHPHRNTRARAQMHTVKFWACLVEKALLVLIKTPGVNSQSKLRGQDILILSLC